MEAREMLLEAARSNEINRLDSKPLWNQLGDMDYYLQYFTDDEDEDEEIEGTEDSDSS